MKLRLKLIFPDHRMMDPLLMFLATILAPLMLSRKSLGFQNKAQRREDFPSLKLVCY
jgi:hypothetical protein